MRGRPAVLAGTIFVVVLALDQITKALVRANVERGSEDPILPALKLVHVKNDGVAFGLDVGGQALVVVLIGCALLALTLYFLRHADKPMMWLPVGLLLGGAIGNIIDRIHAGEVTDFLKLPKWPAFNVADIAITFGVITLIYVLEFKGRGDERAADRA